jgi:parallel beta-helix repeat protein
MNFRNTCGFVLAAVLAVGAWAHGRTYVVSQNHPGAADTNAGDQAAPLKTISAAAQLAEPGDTVLVHAGVYRERVSPARGGQEGQPITYEAAAGEAVLIKGSDLWRPAWTPVQGASDVYEGRLDAAMFAGGPNPYMLSLRNTTAARPLSAGPDGKLPQRWPETRGQLFVDGRMYVEAQSPDEVRATACTWIAAADGNSLMVHFDAGRLPPAKRMVELTIRERIFAPVLRNLGYITVRGFIMEHAANPFPGFSPDGNAQMGALGCRSGHHWVIENNTVRLAKSVGIDCGSEGRGGAGPSTRPAGRPASQPASAGAAAASQPASRPRGQRGPDVAGWHLIRNNIISDNGICGLTGIGHTRTQVIGNIIERNNIMGAMVPESGGIKFHRFTEGLIEGNLVRDNDCWGIWLDNGWTNARVTRNLVLNNQSAGIFIELGAGPCLVDNNVVAYTRRGSGLYSHDAANVTWAHNLTYCNSQWGAYIRVASDRNNRSGGASNHRLANNIFIDDFAGAICMGFPFEYAKGNISDYNLFSCGNQWQWTMPASPLFMPDDNEKRVKWDAIAAAFEAAMNKANVPDAQRPNLSLWRGIPLLTLAQWQMLMGHDTHSVVAEFQRRGQAFQSRYMNFEFEVDDGPWKLDCPAVAGVDRDYFGNAMPAQRPLPGPFQNLSRRTSAASRPAATAPAASRPAGDDPLADRPGPGTGNSSRFVLWPVEVK